MSTAFFQTLLTEAATEKKDSQANYDSMLNKQMTEAETEKKDLQANYDSMLNKSAEKRMLDSKSLTQKESTKASVKGDLTSHRI